VTASEMRRSLDAAYGSLLPRVASELDSSAVMGLAMDAWTQPLGEEGGARVVTAAVYAVLPPRDSSGMKLKPKQPRVLSTHPRRSVLLGLSVSPFSDATKKKVAMTDALIDLTNRVTDELAIDVCRRLISDGSRRSIPVISCANKLLRSMANKAVNSCPHSQHADMTAVRAALGMALMLPWSVRQRVCALSPSLLSVLSTINMSMFVCHEKDWVEVLETITKYRELHSAVTTIISAREDGAGMDTDALKRLLVPDEVLERLQELREALNSLASVKRKLSLRDGEPLHLVHRLFDAVRSWIRGCGDAFPLDCPPDIEGGVVLVLQGRERSLCVEKKRAMAMLKLDRGGDDDDSSEEQFSGFVGLSFADAAILAATGGVARRTRFMDLGWMPSTAEDRELLFPSESSSDSVLSMSPLTVEMLAMLRFNRDLWSLDGVGGELEVSGDGDGDGKKKRKARTNRGAVKSRRTDAVAH